MFQLPGKLAECRARGQGSHRTTRLRADLRQTGDAVERHLAQSVAGQARIRLAYLIAHESHHRGQILLALEQQRLRLPDKVAVQGVWGTWLSGA